MKLPVLFLAAVTLLSLSGCVASRRTLSLNVPPGPAAKATQGKACVVLVTDNRTFLDDPADPSIPSVDGDVGSLSAAQKDRMIGRGRNRGRVVGDIELAENDSVTKRVRLLVEEGLRRSGYVVTSHPEGAMPVTVSVEKFWAWTKPGVLALTFEARIGARVMLQTPRGNATFLVMGFGENLGQSGGSGNWLESYDPAFEDFLSNFKREMSQVAAAAAH